MIILGVDPGLVTTGVVVAEKTGSSFTIKCIKEVKTKSSNLLGRRLKYIFSSVKDIVDSYKPGVLVLEKVYSHYRHPTTVGVLGQVRGIILLLAAQKGMKIVEYPATQVKKAITSYGTASKEQMKRMVSYLAGLKKPLKSQHLADALALVLAFLHTQK